MRVTPIVMSAALCIAGLSCDESPTETPPDDSHIQVFVYWDDEGLPDRRLQVVELDLEALTDADGLADFTVPPGRYTLRAYVNGGGPPLFQDFDVKTQEGRTTRIDVLDCLPCVNS